MRLSVVSVAALIVLVLAPSARGQDTKRLADQIIRSIRPTQHADGTYGSGFVDTCRVLDLLGRSPRRYTELDGPFFRRAAQSVAAHTPVGRTEEAWTVLALSGCVTAPLRTARDAARDRLAEWPGAWTDERSLLALRTLPPATTHWGTPPAGSSAALRSLLAEDPEQIQPPEVTEVTAWTAWARASRLRGIDPVVTPDLPPPPGQADLHALLVDLERVVVLHGLQKPTPVGQRPADDRPAQLEQPHDLRASLEHALQYLDAQQMDGTFGMPGVMEGPEPGITALCLSAALTASAYLEVPAPEWVDSGLDYLLARQRPDGAILDYGVAVYTTSVALEALADGGRPGDRDALRMARDFLISMQADEDLGYDSVDDPHYGGIGYGGDERPDLSNTQMALEAASRAGLPEDSDFTAKALVFLQRTQNLGEINKDTWERADGGIVMAGTDGGATYMPGNSPAGEDALRSGVYQARSYGSMTYALTKSYLLCGLQHGDPRLDAALGWILSHYTLERNPGFKDPAKSADGLYYYYLALARTLRMLPDERLVDEQGHRISWRSDLRDKLLGEQRTDGSWFNGAAPRWFEGAPTLCTAYALLALDAARDPTDR